MVSCLGWIHWNSLCQISQCCNVTGREPHGRLVCVWVSVPVCVVGGPPASVILCVCVSLTLSPCVCALGLVCGKLRLMRNPVSGRGGGARHGRRSVYIRS